MAIRNLLYNEQENGKTLYQNGFKGDESFWKNVYALSKYLHHDLTWGKDRIKSHIEMICEQNNINAVRNRVAINDIVNKALRGDYVNMKNVEITFSELSAIRTVKDFFAQKVALCVLFLMKRRDYTTFTDFDVKLLADIKFMLHDLNVTRTKIKKALKLIYKSGLLKIERHPYYIINFVNTNPSDKVVLYITTDAQAKALVQTYVTDIVGGNLGYCSDCGGEFFKNNQKQIRCNSCATTRNIKLTSENRSKRRV